MDIFVVDIPTSFYTRDATDHKYHQKHSKWSKILPYMYYPLHDFLFTLYTTTKNNTQRRNSTNCRSNSETCTLAFSDYKTP